MSSVPYPSRRRCARVFHRMRLQASGRGHDGRKFRETCETLVVDANGGLLCLRHEVNEGELLILGNPLTQEEQECRVVFLGESGEKGQRIGVEFLSPAPHFWGLDFATPPPSGPGETSEIH